MRKQVGWFGFNGGSAEAANASAAMAMLSTHIAASTAGISWMVRHACVARIMAAAEAHT